jgi:hypothetical protein
MLRVFTLVKLFDRVEHAEAMIRGHLHMKCLRFFREYTDADGELRGDRYEGVGAIFQPSQLGELRLGDIVIPAKDLAGPILIRPDHRNWHVFCTFAVTNDGLLGEKVSADSLSQLKKAMQIHEECFGLGKHAVLLTQPNTFLERVGDALGRLGRSWKRNLVEYYDDASFHGYFPPDDVPFRKRARFRLQREYRFAVEADPDSDEPLTLDVGDLSDVALLTNPDWINANITLSLPDGSTA